MADDISSDINVVYVLVVFIVPRQNAHTWPS